MSQAQLLSKWVSISLADNEAMDAYLVKPQGAIKGGIVMLQEIFGVNAAMQEKAREFASRGYVVLVPDLFWRSERKIDLGYGEDDRKRGFGLMQQYDQAKGTTDIVAAVSWLKSQTGIVSLVGFCLGGRMAVLAGAKSPDVAAVISFYGVALDKCENELRSLRVPFQFHVGDNDAHIPTAVITAVQDATKDMSNTKVFVYPGAQHGFFNRARPEVFDGPAASLAQERALSVLQEHA